MNKRVVLYSFGTGCILFLLVFAAHYFSPAWRFMRQSHDSFREFGKACDELRRTYPLGASLENPKREVIPPIIEKEHPVHIEISSNRVDVLAGGGGRIWGYTITWMKSEQSEKTWELRVFDGAWDHTLIICYGPN